MPEKNSSSRNVKLFIETVSERGSSGEGFKVLLSDGSSFFISTSFLSDRGLTAGQPVSDELLEDLVSESERIKALLKAGELLARSENSSGGLYRKLVKKGFSESSSRSAVDRVRELGLLDDARFARFWLEDRLRHHPEGRRALLGGLINRGVPHETAANAIGDILSEEDMLQAVMKAGRKISVRSKGDDLKLRQALSRRGFSSAEIRYFFKHREI